jgi:hypothetical protein
MKVPKIRAMTANGIITPMAILDPVENSPGGAAGGVLESVDPLVEVCALVDNGSEELAAAAVVAGFNVDMREGLLVSKESSCKISVSVACHRTCISSTHTVGWETVATLIEVSVGFAGIAPSARFEVE